MILLIFFSILFVYKQGFHIRNLSKKVFQNCICTDRLGENRNTYNNLMAKPSNLDSGFFWLLTEFLVFYFHFLGPLVFSETILPATFYDAGLYVERFRLCTNRIDFGSRLSKMFLDKFSDLPVHSKLLKNVD